MKEPRATPQELYGPLLAAVQQRNILADGKAFVDAIPKRPISDIMADFAQLEGSAEALSRFVAENFELPPEATVSRPADPRIPLRDYIRSLWADLAREPATETAQSSALPVRHRHVVPGGRFREIYYWDSFFTLLGLVRDGEMELATGIVDAMTDLIEDHGHVPNGARTYFLGRSQPPLYHMMVALLEDGRPDVAARRLGAMKREHAWWMDGAGDLAPNQSAKRVARLADGSLVNRYWDPRGTPRDESWREDVATAMGSGRAADDIYRNLRAGAESGWDFSSRWLDDGSLSSIRTTTIAPIDLNAFLFGLEQAIADASDDGEAAAYAALAEARREALCRHFWNEGEGFFADYDLDRQVRRAHSSAAGLTPLLVGIATPQQAGRTAAYFGLRYLAPGGLRTTLTETGQQWDKPNGWAPLQWIAATGLARYGHDRLAREIAERWVSTVERTYRITGLLHEKYDIEAGDIGWGGEYAAQTGFGWTNGVTADFIDRR